MGTRLQDEINRLINATEEAKETERFELLEGLEFENLTGRDAEINFGEDNYDAGIVEGIRLCREFIENRNKSS